MSWHLYDVAAYNSVIFAQFSNIITGGGSRTKFLFTGLIYSINYWSGNDKFMYKVTFPLRLVIFPGVNNLENPSNKNYD